jgi:uncharacterized protein YdaU (DUF1376 family)
VKARIHGWGRPRFAIGAGSRNSEMSFTATLTPQTAAWASASDARVRHVESTGRVTASKSERGGVLTRSALSSGSVATTIAGFVGLFAGGWSLIGGPMPKHDHPPYFPFYVDDFISDSAVDAMTNEELGIYVRLLCKAWKESPVGTIPNDDELLAKWCRIKQSGWRRVKTAVLRAFVLDGGRYHQKRMEHEWAKALMRISVRTEAGKRGAEGRWQTHSNRNGKRTILPMANDGYSESESESCSESESLDVDVDGARDVISKRELDEIRAKANRFSKVVDCQRPDNRNLVAKVAVLWQRGSLSEDDVEQVIESFARAEEPIENPGAWLHQCFVNRCAKCVLNFEALLATTVLPPELEAGT